ncbi:hypothetical protein [Massilimicrobiota timonensis]|uniref:hypothetical protein n=1 Tax=Massilimicrobiota timonensis TaxID=1776392 RepID=UPI001961148F|nr:hypothetical protein [Massilimicrobiota timonensis]MBM6966919.1 hypothetical protein [Massilimicrobiota timonensis]
MKKSTKKLILSLALVGTVGVGSTLAYLATTGNTVTNSFVSGAGYPDGENSVYIDEYDITKENGLPRTKVKNEYKNVSEGGTLTKDPQVHLVANSVESYILVKIEGLDANKDKLTPKVDTEEQDVLPADGINDAWEKISTNVGLDGIYKYKTTVQGGTDIEEKLFDKILVGDDIKRNENGEASFNNITLSVCAMQAVTYNDDDKVTVAFDADNIPDGFVNGYTIAE